ncbi:MAG: exopolysaccharide biosynthesis protein [Paenibacillaceae bacterium]|jgi:exopolysaccharide biosynthesis protein|nr:exopolysaccharide biosynthesis protein [Paenibacillaceae bacterium]
MNANQAVNRLFLMATAPFLGMMIWMLTVQTSQLMPAIPQLLKLDSPAFTLGEETAAMEQQLEQAAEDSSSIKTTIQKYFDTYTKSAEDVSVMLERATAQTGRPALIFDNRIAAAFGQPVKHAASANIDLKLYSFQDQNYRGYALKAELKTDKAMKMALGGDKLGKSETTLAAANRLGAIAGVNAGGFADANGKRYPTGNTIQNGKYVYGFFPSGDLVFVGMNGDRQLIGGKFDRQDQLDKLNPQFGASFTPILLQEGKKQTIPVKWMTSPYRAARTVVGNFRNNQILFIVTNGSDDRGSSGASLAELQDKLQTLGVQDAYNLDGGGSSTLVWGNEVVNQPSDGRMRAMPTHFVFFK